jgi:A/G-specific adenine glycosylase
MNGDISARDFFNLKESVKRKRSAIATCLLRWGKKNSSCYPWRGKTSSYMVLISELLLRKTRADKVAEIFPHFIDRFPTPEAITTATVRDVRNIIRPLGRLKRDREIMKVAHTIVDRYSGKVPTSEEELFVAIGRESRYTVSAIRCFAYGERVPIFDVNVSRVLSRVFSVDFGKQPHKNERAWTLAAKLLPDKNVKEFNWALLDLGRTVCTRIPKCEICPLISVCDYARDAADAEQK